MYITINPSDALFFNFTFFTEFVAFLNEANSGRFNKCLNFAHKQSTLICMYSKIL